MEDLTKSNQWKMENGDFKIGNGNLNSENGEWGMRRQCVLSLNSEEESKYSDLHKELLQDEIDELTPIGQGQLSLDIRYVYEEGNTIDISYFLRSTASKDAYIRAVEFGIFEKYSDEMLLCKEDDLTYMGRIPSMGAKIGSLAISKDEFGEFEDYYGIDVRFVNKLEIMKCED